MIKTITYKLIKVVFGLFLFALGIVMTINANIGVAPWDVFHQGLNNTFGITMGVASIIVGFFIVFLDFVLGQNIGWATIMNMILIGVFMDVLMLNNLVPIFNGFLPSLIMLVLGVLVEGYGCWIYMSAGLGAGPRDGLMVVLTKRTGKSVRVVKSFTEVLATLAGYLLGGSLGIGTLIMALFGGQIFQFAFKTVKFDVKNIETRYIQDDVKFLKEKLKLIKSKINEG
jgi:uncharacterized membrane protein YczE